MKVLIHDLSTEEWNKIKDKYSDFKVISNNGKVASCCGCFGCWVKEPGKCVIKDSYDNTPELMAHSEKVVVISRLTWGGFSSFVKNIFDRNIGYVLPIIKGMGEESHHSKRYDTPINMAVIFYGNSITEDDKKKSKKYVEAVCTNLHANLESIVYEEAAPVSFTKSEITEPKGVVLLNCSYRGNNANSKSFLDKLSALMDEPVKIYNLVSYEHKEEDLLTLIKNSKTIVMAMPLYVDGAPSRVVKLMEKLYQTDNGGNKNIYVISNMGFFESRQIVNLLSIVKTWADNIGYRYCGGIAIGGGEMLGPMINDIQLGKGPAKDTGLALLTLKNAIANNETMDDMYVNANIIPRFVFNTIANTRWTQKIKANGLKKKDLYRKY